MGTPATIDSPIEDHPPWEEEEGDRRMGERTDLVEPSCVEQRVLTRGGGDAVDEGLGDRIGHEGGEDERLFQF